MKRFNLRVLFLAGAFALAACAVGPDYAQPPVDTPAAYKEQTGDWKPATPRDTENRGAWWALYNDPVLGGLEDQVEVSNQNLKAAEAAYRASRAIVAETQATLFPTLSLDASAARSHTGAPVSKTQNQYNAALGASWEPDIWGRIRRTLESDVANAETGAADLASARLSAQSALASSYFSLRTQDELKNLLAGIVKNQQRTLKIVQNQYDAGVAAKADVVAAETQLKTTQAQAISVDIQRTQFEHAIAVLIGKPPSDFSLPPSPLGYEPPLIPGEVPSALLERRPDIAAAERQMAAANAQIGVQTAAFFPNLTLSASYGYAASALGKLLQASNSLWSFGPALAETLIDFGARSARVEQARAAYDQSVALYRQTVLSAFQQVEDQLAAQRILADQARAEANAVKSAHEAERLVLNQYKAGIVPLSSVLVAQNNTLTNEQAALAVRRDRFAASINLIEALGGNWSRAQLPDEEALR